MTSCYATDQEALTVAEVVVELANKEILRVALKGPTMSIGRDPQCDLHLDNRALSRRHAQIEKRGAAIWVRDLESQNGTYVNGNKISEPRALNGGDVVEVGRYLVRIEGAEEAKTDTPVLTLTGPEGRHRFAMVGDEIVIGRAPSCDIAIGHKSISRRHLRIALNGAQFIAEDLGSQNGTRLGNKRITGPTPFRLGEKLQMSEFSIEVGYLESPATGAMDKASKTMMIDRSELANAAYVGGDFEKMQSNANSQVVQVGNMDLGDDEPEESGTAGVPEFPPPPPPPKPRKAAPAPPPAPPPAQVIKAAKKPQLPWLAVTHPDLRKEQAVQLAQDVTVLGEDGSSDDGTGGRTYANQAYVLFTRLGGTVIASSAGDRRLITVNGKPCLFCALQPQDVVELGLLSAVFHLPG